MIKLNTITNNYAQLDDNQLVKLVQYENYDALAELWKRHADYIKKVTLGQYYKIRPDFSEDAHNSERLWNNRMSDSYFNLEKAALNYNPSYKTPFLAYFAMNNKYAFLDEKELNTERDKRHFYCENYDCYGSREDDTVANMEDIMQAIAKCLRKNKPLLAFFQKYTSIIKERGYINQSKMALIMRVTRQTINTNFKKIHAIAKLYGLEKEFLAMLSTRGSAT
jgi:hypothetical protein